MSRAHNHGKVGMVCSTAPRGRPSRDAERTRGEILDVATQRVRRQRLRRRAGGRDRGADPHDQADDLLLLRRQGRALRRRARARVRRASASRAAASTSSTSTRSRRSGGWPSSRSTTTSRTRTSSGWSASRTSTAPSTSPGRRRCADLNSPAHRRASRAILERGHAAGAFRADVDAIDVHMMISAFCVFRIANRHTFGDDLRPRPARPRRCATTTAGCSATWSSTTSARA